MLAAVVIPTYNEKNNIKNLIPAIKSQKLSGVKFLLIVVDDNSPDGTAQEAKKCDLISGIWEEIKYADDILKGNKNPKIKF